MGELTHSSSGPLKTLNPKRALENISGISLDCIVKHKRRKISAMRDFPRCCRRKALEINGKPSGENSTLGAVGAVLVDSGLSNSTNLGERSSKSVVDVMALVKSLNGHKPIDSLTTSKESVSIETELLKGSDKKDLLDHLGTMQSKVTELSTTQLGDASNSKCLDQCVLPNASQSANPLVLMEMSSGLDQQESIVSQKVTVQSIEAKEENAPGFHQLALPCATASTNQSKVDMSGSLEQIDSIQSEKDGLQLLDVRIPALQSANENVPRKIPGRRLSCHRDFPPGCGRNVPPLPKKGLEETIALTGKILTEESCSIEMDGTLNVKDVVSKSERSITKETKREVHVESALENDTIGDETEGNENNVKFRESSGKNLDIEDSKRNQIGATRQSKSREPDMCFKSKGQKTNKVVGRPVKKLGDESMEFHKDKKSERKFMSETDNEVANVSKSVGEVSVDLGYSSKKTILRGNVAGDREKKQKPVVNHSCNSVCRKKDANRSSLSAESPDVNLRNEGKLPQIGKIASWHKNEQAIKDEVDSFPHEDDKDFEVPRAQEMTVSMIPFVRNQSAIIDDCGKTARQKVRETLRLFQAICRKLLWQEETKLNQQVQIRGRIAMLASMLLKERNKWVNTGKPIIGNVPGIEVGDEFHYRVELAIVGLHCPFQSGIDFTKQGETFLATSVVASGRYANEDYSDVLVYSGQGGQPVGGIKKAEDQKLTRGNLALKNCIDAKTLVRVIHGYKVPRINHSQAGRRKTAIIYTYDGLYSVEKYWQVKGDHGCSVFKFELRRVPGQPELAVKVVKKLAAREGVCVLDISQGKEKLPICAVNTIDEEHPLHFKYITEMMYPSWYNPTPPRGCDCTNRCSDSKKCVCVIKNGGVIPFNRNGAIIEAKPLVYECGPSCGCPPSCYNRVSQHGIKFQLEIFKTESRGWGVRSLTSISSGSFICEYAGELLRDREAEQRTSSDEYLFDIGHDYDDYSHLDDLSNLTSPALQSNVSDEVADDGEYTVDAAEYGNVGRFINHSCSPNLYAQNVLYDHDDKRVPHIMLFAAENIPPLQELTYHYNYKIDQVHDSDGYIKQKKCYCGSSDCSGRLY